jgi:hypothetical protein
VTAKSAASDARPGSGKAPDKVAMIASASANPVDAQNATSSVARNAGSRVRASGV